MNALKHIMKDFSQKYENRSLEIQKKSRLLFMYYVVGLIILPSHFCYIYFYANQDIMKIFGSLLAFVLLIIAMIFLVKGKYYISANISLCTMSLLIIYATNQFIITAPSQVYNNTYFIILVIIVQASLFNNKLWLSGVSIIFLALDIYTYYSIKSHIQDSESLLYAASFMSSFIAIFAAYILALFSKIITQAAISKSENESAINFKQYSIIKELLDSVAQTSSKLAVHSDLLTNNANTFFEGSQNQAATIEEISSAQEEVMSGVEQVFEVLNEQHQGLITLLQKMKDLFLITSGIGEQVENVNLSTEEITTMAQKGNDALKKMEIGMKRVSDSANSMKNIVSMISTIADKINLLSLNASIEAARAGSSGRGFAVVADEISRLGSMTQLNMNEIDKLIQSTSGDIKAGLDSVNLTVSTMSDIIDSIHRIIEEINAISEKTKMQQDINQMVNSESEKLKAKSDQIKDMTGMQQIALNEIVKSLTSINDITQTYVDGSRKLYSDAEMVGKLAEILKQDVNVH